MMRRSLLALTLCIGGLQADWWDSVTNVLGPSGQEEESGPSSDDKLKILNAAISSNTLPPNLQMSLLVERGNIYLDNEQYQQALNDFNAVLARKPEDKDTLLEALAGQAKAQLALGNTDQYLATRTILINLAPPEGYPVESDYYYLVSFPDTWGGHNWWRNPGWRGPYRQWLHNNHYHSPSVVFSKNNVNVVKKPKVKTVPSIHTVPPTTSGRPVFPVTPANPTKPAIHPPLNPVPPVTPVKPGSPTKNVEEAKKGVVEKLPETLPAEKPMMEKEREREAQRSAERVERPQSRPAAPAARPAPDRSDRPRQ